MKTHEAYQVGDIVADRDNNLGIVRKNTSTNVYVFFYHPFPNDELKKYRLNGIEHELLSLNVKGFI